MRRFFVILLCALAVVPTAVAAARATGDGVLELKAVYGTVSIGKEGQPARGVAWGQMDKGKLVAVDPAPADGNKIFVSGWEKRTVVVTSDGGPSIVVYTGTNLHFRVDGGKYRLTFVGSGIDLTAVGVGVAYLSGDILAADAGDYALDSGNWTPVPVSVLPQQKPFAVPFGTQAATTTTTTTTTP
jgi:hypothetical protein